MRKCTCRSQKKKPVSIPCVRVVRLGISFSAHVAWLRRGTAVRRPRLQALYFVLVKKGQPTMTGDETAWIGARRTKQTLTGNAESLHIRIDVRVRLYTYHVPNSCKLLWRRRTRPTTDPYKQSGNRLLDVCVQVLNVFFREQIEIAMENISSSRIRKRRLKSSAADVPIGRSVRYINRSLIVT